MKIRTVFCVVIGLLPVVACKVPGPGSSGSTSSSSSGGGSGAPVERYIDYCLGLMDMVCVPPCAGSEDESDARCRALHQQSCEDSASHIEARIDAGRILFSAQEAQACLDLYEGLFGRSARAGCTSTPEEENRAVVDFFSWLLCDDGKYAPGWWKDSSDSCGRVLAGAVPADQSCGYDRECSATLFCAGLVDGGCGTCSPADAGVVDAGRGDAGPRVPRGGVCAEMTDGGRRTTGTCADGLACDETTNSCVPNVARGAACGPGVGRCSTVCGYACTTARTGDTGECVPLPGPGEPCSDERPCERGQSCVGIRDGGTGQCRPHARENEACSPGLNGDYFYYLFFGDLRISGGYPRGADPVCIFGTRCAVTQDGGTAGTCETAPEWQPGEHCWITVDPSEGHCVVPRSSCTYTRDAGYVCSTPASEGAPCTTVNGCQSPLKCLSADGGKRCTPGRIDGELCSEDDCRDGSFCERPDGGTGQCHARYALGASCRVDEGCPEFSRCYQGVCTRREDIEPSFPPMCLQP